MFCVISTKLLTKKGHLRVEYDQYSGTIFSNIFFQMGICYEFDYCFTLWNLYSITKFRFYDQGILHMYWLHQFWEKKWFKSNWISSCVFESKFFASLPSKRFIYPHQNTTSEWLSTLGHSRIARADESLDYPDFFLKNLPKLLIKPC